ncbi:MAG TPA: SCO family protein [Stellaceae bacterium]|nr:SCO family protein [Stellaceae bacterium]
MTRGHASLRLAIFAGVAMLAVNAAAPASEFRTSEITGQGYGDAMPVLVDQDGRARGRDDFKGRVTVLLFGFTHCPDLCPTALSTLSVVLDELGEERDRVQIAFITVDPERDTPEVLHDYMSGFGPNFVGLTGELLAVRKAAKTFKVFFQKIPLPGGDYTMDHSAVMYVVDPQARVRLMFTASRQPEDVAHDILELLREPN